MNDAGKPVVADTVLNLVRLGDSIPFAKDSIFNWVSDFEVWGGECYVTANQSGQKRATAVEGKLFKYHPGSGKYAEIAWGRGNERYNHLKLIGDSLFILKMSQVCRLNLLGQSCDSVGFGKYRDYKAFDVMGGYQYALVDNHNDNFTYTLIKRYNNGQYVNNVLDFVMDYQFHGDKLYAGNGQLTIYPAPNGSVDILFPGQGVFAGLYELVGTVKFVGEKIFVNAYTRFDRHDLFVRDLGGNDTSWIKLEGDIPEENTDLVNIGGVQDFGHIFEIGGYAVYFDSRTLHVIRISDLAVRRAVLGEKILGSKWLRWEDRVYTNGWNTLFSINISEIDNLFLTGNR